MQDATARPGSESPVSDPKGSGSGGPGIPGLGSSAMAPWLSLAGQMKKWADSVMIVGGPAADLAMASAGAQAQDPKQRAAILQAGAMLKQMRESAGMTVQDVSRALDLKDPALLETAESGGAALPFEIILRLASVVGREDPATAMMRLTRAYNPALWKTLDQAGIGRLMVQAGREREVANIYRASDDARRLSDEEFASVLEFMRQAFNMAVQFRMAAKDDLPKPQAVPGN